MLIQNILPVISPQPDLDGALICTLLKEQNYVSLQSICDSFSLNWAHNPSLLLIEIMKLDLFKIRILFMYFFGFYFSFFEAACKIELFNLILTSSDCLMLPEAGRGSSNHKCITRE